MGGSDSAVSGAFDALLVDYGGVLTNALNPLLQEFCRSLDLHEDAVFRLLTDESEHLPLFHAYERGELTAEEFLPQFASALGITTDELDRMLADLRPDERMFQAIGEARRQGIKTSLVSNSWGTALYPRDLLAEAFDDVVISGEVGLRKPDVAIFSLAVERLGVDARRCVFIDDTVSHFVGAEALGISVVHHQQPSATILELETLLGLSLEPSRAR